MNLDNPTHHGCDGNCQTIWDENPFPDDLSELLTDKGKNEDGDVDFIRDDGDYDNFESQWETNGNLFIQIS